MRITRIHSAEALVALGLTLALAAPVIADEAPRLLPFQARLTDQNGASATNGERLILFRIFDQATAGDPVWAGEVHRTTINGGMVNVLLGSKTPLPTTNSDGAPLFNQKLYLELTVDINGDNAITAADPPLLPRQILLPALFAKESDNARSLGGVPAADLALGLVPVGSVLPFYGVVGSLPANWRLCDGSPVNDPLSPFDGQFLPNLMEMFLRGASPSYPVNTTGGQDFIASHSHFFSASDSSVSFPLKSGNGYVSAYHPATSAGAFDNSLRNLSAPDGAANPYNSHGHINGFSSVSGTTFSSGSHDNRPRFFSINYIIRIR
ncbi:MAG: hypothetical protein HY299_12590 [Verrucomicrobia bacterium]|nr:hypothetical protein [Verrucomicrobiota bacterium]